MTELLVLLACAQGSGCSASTSAYFSAHPGIKQSIRMTKRKAINMVGPEIVTLSPLVVLITGGRATFRLTKHFNFQTGNDQNMVIFRLDF